MALLCPCRCQNQGDSQQRETCESWLCDTSGQWAILFDKDEKNQIERQLIKQIESSQRNIRIKTNYYQREVDTENI